jgi:hypothetical protein
VNAEFNWWLLIVGLVIGAGLVWLVVADGRRREVDVGDAERVSEARWIAEAMTDAGRSVDDEDVLDILRLHAAYLAAAPPDQAFDDSPEDGPSTGDRRWASVASMTGAVPVGTERRAMAHPLDPGRPGPLAATGREPVEPVAPVDGADREGGQT